MGNHQQHQQIQKQINQLQIIKKNSHSSILKNKSGIEYIKLLYTPTNEEKQTHQSIKTRTNSIFNKKYLQYRFECQNHQNKLKKLPKILAFGKQSQNLSIISCTDSQLSFVIFQHPIKSLKQQIDHRITTGQVFKQFQYLNLIKSVVEGLSQYFDHIKSWNQELLQRKSFFINEENIYLNYKGEFIVSDILSNLNEIEHISKQQVTLKKSSRVNSMSNLHAKVSSRKIRQKFFQTNLNNLASIIEGIIFKFQCFTQPHKNSSQQSQSLSTALQSYRGATKNSQLYSSQFEKLLKQLRQTLNNQIKIMQETDKLINAVHLPVPIERSEQNSNVLSRKNSVQKIVAKSVSCDKLKLNGINSFVSQQGRNPLGEILNFTQNTFLKQQKRYQRYTQNAQNKKITNYESQNNKIVEQRIAQRNITKIRLSLKKDSQIQSEIENKQSSIEKQKNMKQKSSHPKFLCSKTHQNQAKDKQNIQAYSKINFTQNQQKAKISSNSDKQKLTQKILNSKLVDCLKDEKSLQPQKKKILLKKGSAKKGQKSNTFQAKPMKKQQTQTMIHLNPMSRKKTFGLNKFLNCQSKQKVNVLKTVQKGVHEMDMQFLQNLSSIMSNQNNTISSYGIPMTDEFKTDNSLIQDEGCIGFNDNDQPSPIKFNNSKQILSQPNQFIKKNSSTFSPPCVKLSSYPSLQLVQSLIQKRQDKIPQFLKQFKLPQKHLLALNNIILKQKDMIMQQSFEQSQFNSIRHSVPNIFGIQEQLIELKKKRNSKINIQNVQLQIKKQTIQLQIKKQNIIQNHNHISQLISRKQQADSYMIVEPILYQKQSDSIQRQLKFIQISLNNNDN